MIKLYRALRVAMFSILGLLIGRSLYLYRDYKARPGFYEMNSAPWYTEIYLNVAIAGFLILIIMIIRHFMEKKIKRK